MKDKKLSFLNCKELAKRIGVSESTLKYWRANSTGPAYIKVGQSIRYPKDLLLNWERGLLVDPEKVATSKRPKSWNRLNKIFA